MKQFLVAFCLIAFTTTVTASTSVGSALGLIDSGLSQYQCTIQVQQIDSSTGKMGQRESIYSIVVAADSKSAKTSALNKLNFYGPIQGSLFYITDDQRQFEVKSIKCN